MEKKCSKYESLFIFSDEKCLENHIQECEVCKAEHEKMQKVSELLSEVKFYYRNKNRKKLVKFRIACALMLVMFSSLSLGLVVNDDDFMDTLKYGETLSAEDLGFPVDSYGLLMVDDEI